MCEDDGFNTVEAARYEGLSVEALVGRVFSGRYRVEAMVGEGGMGSVYRAIQLSVNRSVALKILRPEYASNLEQVRRFQTEARAASALDHPHTIRVIDFGQSDDGALYLVTEFLEGETLSELIEREQVLDPWRSARIACQILKSLSEAHAQGIVHRDLKPENIFLKRVHGEDDFIKVLDFGIAKVSTSDQDRRSLTVTGTVVGTPLYMAPEQARGHKVGFSADIYALGVLLYEMVAGEPPFTGETAMQVMMEHIQSDPPTLGLSLAAPSLIELEDIIGWCLAKESEGRPRTADELRLRLEAFLGDSEPVPPLGPARKTPPSVRTLGDEALAPTMGVEAAQLESSFDPPGKLVSEKPLSMTREAIAFVGLERRRRNQRFFGIVAVLALLGLLAIVVPRLLNSGEAIEMEPDPAAARSAPASVDQPQSADRSVARRVGEPASVQERRVLAEPVGTANIERSSRVNRSPKRIKRKPRAPEVQLRVIKR